MSAVTVLPGVIDHHVHLGLVERDRLTGGPLVEVFDCGWDPHVALRWREHPPAGLRVKVAGPFHTAAGGYPSGRDWAPPEAVRQIRDLADAGAASAAAAAGAYDAFKIALHSGMPLLSDKLLQALVDGAHAEGLTVLVHAEGDGQAMRAVDAGADVLVHTPWTESLTDTEINRAIDATTWISTLAIHSGDDRRRAVHNLRRFHERGGKVLYGTDMGNGRTPPGVSPDELLALGEAGLSGSDLRAAVFAAGPPLLRSELPEPQTAQQLVSWLRSAQRVETTGRSHG